MTADQIVWQTRPDGQSVGAQRLHIAAAEIYSIPHFIAGQAMDPSDMELLMSAKTRVDEGL